MQPQVLCISTRLLRHLITTQDNYITVVSQPSSLTVQISSFSSYKLQLTFLLAYSHWIWLKLQKKS